MLLLACLFRASVGIRVGVVGLELRMLRLGFGLGYGLARIVLASDDQQDG